MLDNTRILCMIYTAVLKLWCTPSIGGENTYWGGTRQIFILYITLTCTYFWIDNSLYFFYLFVGNAIDFILILGMRDLNSLKTADIYIIIMFSKILISCRFVKNKAESRGVNLLEL